MSVLTFWFDLSCPYAYLASTQVERLAAEAGADLWVRPFLLGGVFRARGVAQNLAGTLHPDKAAHNLADMHRHAALFGVPLVMPPGHPLRTVRALRALLVVQRDEGDPSGRCLLPLMHALYRAYWVDGVDVSTGDGLAEVLRGQGLDATAVLAATEEQEIKDRLRALTDEALELGVFGAPALVVGEGGEATLFWGQDRLDHVLRALGTEPPSAPTATDGPPVEVWFDYSSPFAYLGVTRARRFLGARVRWRPMLLGAVFKDLGGPIVPLQTFSDAKRAWVSADLGRQAAEAGAELNWPSRFPLRTVLPLRVTLQALEQDVSKGEAFIHRAFRGCWVDDQDPQDPEVVARWAEEVGLDGEELVRGAAEAHVKQALFAATQDARSKGVFGAPTFVKEDGTLFWGNDRLPLLAALEG